MCGTGVYEIALWTSLFVTVAMLFYSYMPERKTPYLLVINAKDADAGPEIMKIVDEYAKYHKIRSRNLNSKSYDLVIEIRTNKEHEIVQKFQKM